MLATAGRCLREHFQSVRGQATNRSLSDDVAAPPRSAIIRIGAASGPKYSKANEGVER